MLSELTLAQSLKCTWTTTGSLATARFSHTATLQISNAVLISGGRDATGALARSERYDEATGTCEGEGHARHAQIAAHGDAASLGYGPHRRGSRLKRLSPERRAVRRVVLDADGFTRDLAQVPHRDTAPFGQGSGRRRLRQPEGLLSRDRGAVRRGHRHLDANGLNGDCAIRPHRDAASFGQGPGDWRQPLPCSRECGTLR